MKTRTPKSATAKKTPPAKKSAVKIPQKPTESVPESSTPKTGDTKRVSATKAKQAKNSETTPVQKTTAGSKSEPGAEEAKVSAEVAPVTPKLVSSSKPGAAQSTPKVVSSNKPSGTTPKVVSGGKAAVKVSAKTVQTTPKVGSKPTVKKTHVKSKTPTTAKSVSSQTPKPATPKSGENVVVKVEDSPLEDILETKAVESAKEQELSVDNIGKSMEEEKTTVRGEEPSIEIEEDPEEFEEAGENEDPNFANEGGEGKEDMEENEDTKSAKVEVELKSKLDIVEEDINKAMDGEDAKLEHQGDELMEDVGDEEVHEDLEEEEQDLEGEEQEREEEEQIEDDVKDRDEEADTLEEERRELTAIAKERQIKKKYEIFVGGLDRDSVEEDVRKVFEKIGEIVEVRLHKGYAFVKFANKEHANRALSEMKTPLIRGKRCGTAPSEDNDTLFLGNICNTWTKEAIKQKLMDYGVEGVVNITLVPDLQHEGLSRGFAFLEFSCHPEAMLAYKRLQKPDVIFGHSERTAKVAFAEPLREPDPEIMAQVKSVYVNGLPPHWDEDRVREQFKGYGEIERIMLARNMPTAKRKDFGFVDFTTHEAALACIDGTNKLGDGNSKMKMKARLSNPLPKTQAVKGEMCGGFRIGRGGSGGSGRGGIGSSSKFGRGFGRGGRPFQRPNFQRGRGFYNRGRGHPGRMGFGNEYNLDNSNPEFHGRRNFGRGGRRGAGPAAVGPSRSNLDKPRHDTAVKGRGRHISSSRQPFLPEEGFARPFVGEHFEDPYFYDGSAPGVKRPFYMTDPEPGYMEPSRLRPRLDYSDPAFPFRGSRYHDTFGANSDLYSRDYNGSDYGGGAYSSYYGGDRLYGGGYYY